MTPETQKAPIPESDSEAFKVTSMISPDIAAAQPVGRRKEQRFYRPELDALRFFAFLAVLIHHGPSGPAGGIISTLSRMGGFGLSMFFLLSAYLISELLLREREQTGTVSWGLFFKRRALRIWPLYYGAIIAASIIAQIPPHALWVSRFGIASMIIFVANWFRLSGELGPLLGPLWSISIEEQFYAIWPPIAKWGGERMVLAASVTSIVCAIAWIWMFQARTWKLWYDTPVELIFFACGALIALATHGKMPIGISMATRAGLLIVGFFALFVAGPVAGIGTDNVPGISIQQLYGGYVAAATGCAMLFIATSGLTHVPGWLSYLGKISYGLYVFHGAMIYLTRRLLAPLHSDNHPYLNVLAVDGIALLLCVCAAHLSYQYFERPFLKLKSRFEVVRSRPA